MADEEVWIQLYVGEEKSGEAILIEIASLSKNRIHYLKDAVHQKKGKSLGHCDAADLVVYKAGTQFTLEEPLKEEDKLDPGDNVPKGTGSKNPLLVVAPAIIVKEQEDVLTELKELKASVRAIIKGMKKTRVTPSPSPAQYGGQVLDNAKYQELYTTFQGVENEDAALSPETAVALAACTNEHRLVALLTSPLEHIFENSVCLVNSEAYPWLKTSEDTKYNQKPDLFLCCEEIYTTKPAWTSHEPIPERDETHKFGILSDWALRDCIAAIFEAKVTISNQAVGEAVNYANHILSGDGAPGLAKIVLFDRTMFMLMEVATGGYVKITECEWTKAGSKKLLHDFPLYQNPWTSLVKDACQQWNLEIARDGKGSAWLGRGAYGRVFRVNKVGSVKQMALKVVQETKIGGLSMEKLMLREAASCCDFVMPIEDTKIDLPQALLMSYVGSPVEPNRYQDVIKLLAALHDEGFLHGDPRLANVVSFNGKLYWIDFMDGRMPTTPEAKVEDMKKLVTNILHLFEMEWCQALDCYDGSQDTVPAVITACENYLEPPSTTDKKLSRGKSHSS